MFSKTGKTLPSSPQPDMEGFLHKVVTNEKKLEDRREQLDLIDLEADMLDPDDPQKIPMIHASRAERFTNAKHFAMLAVIKAKYGIVGKSWYKSDEE